MKRIKHSSALMETKRLFCLLLAASCLALAARAEPAVTGAASTNLTYTNVSPTTAGITNAPVTGVSSGDTNALPNPTTLQTAPSPYSAQPRKIRVVTIEECIKLALEHNLDIQIAQYNPIINQYNLNLTYGAYEPVFTMTATKSYNDFPTAAGINPITGLPYLSSIGEADTYTPGVAGVLPTGLQYDLTGQFERSRTLIFPGNAPAFWSGANWISEPGPGINLTQPLLKNLWIDSTRLQIQINKDTLHISEAALRLQVMTSITAVKSAYYTLLYNRGNVEANATAYKLAEQLVTENTKRLEVGTLAPLDEKQSESQAAASLAAMQLAEQQLLTQENALKSLITDHFAEWADVTPLPSEKLIAIPEELNLQESWRLAIAKRPDLAEAKLRIEAQNVTLKYNFNQIFPELDLKGSYGRNADEDNLYDVFSDLSHGNHSYYSYGAFVSVPLGGNYGARNQYKSSKATLKQLLLTLKQTEQNIIIAVDNDVGNVRSTLQQVYATRDARIYADEALAAEKTKLENGKSTSFIVLQLISNLTTARVSEIQALANYNIAVAQLALDEGTTLEANRVDMKLK